MADAAAKRTIRALITQARLRLDEAASVARAAETCAKGGNTDRALKILMDFEGAAYEAQNLFKAAIAIKHNLLDPE